MAAAPAPLTRSSQVKGKKSAEPASYHTAQHSTLQSDNQIENDETEFLCFTSIGPNFVLERHRKVKLGNRIGS